MARAGSLGICWELKDPASSTFTLYDLADRLRERGWLVPAYSMPLNRTDLVIQRILVRHGFYAWTWPTSFCSRWKVS